MKIALLTPTFSKFSGIDRVVELQARKLSKKNQVTIVSFTADLRQPKGVQLVEIGMPKNNFLERVYRLFFFFDQIKINKVARKLKNYDLIISHIYPMNLIASAAKKKYGVKYRFHNHGVATPNLFGTFTERLAMRLFNIFSNHTIKSANEVVSISKYLQKVLKKETGIDSKIEYDIVDKTRFNSKVDGKAIRKKYNLINKPVLVYIGRISPHKGVDALLKAFRGLRSQIPDIYIIIIGKHTFPKYSQQLRQISDDHVIFLGYVKDKDIPSFYAASDVCVTATLWEGFNLTIAEANACGKPVVAFDIGPHSEVMKKGKLVPVGDIQAFARAVKSLLPKRYTKRISHN